MINTCIDFSCSEISSITGYFGKKLATGLKSFGEIQIIFLLFKYVINFLCKRILLYMY